MRVGPTCKTIGPPESPLQTLRPYSPLVQMLELIIKSPKMVLHSALLMTRRWTELKRCPTPMLPPLIKVKGELVKA